MVEEEDAEDEDGWNMKERKGERIEERRKEKDMTWK